MAKDGECCKGKWNCVGIVLIILGILELSSPIFAILTIILGCRLVNCCCGCCGVKCMGCTVAVFAYIQIAINVALAISLYMMLGEGLCIWLVFMRHGGAYNTGGLDDFRQGRDMGIFDLYCAGATALRMQREMETCDLCYFVMDTLPPLLLIATACGPLPIAVRVLRDRNLRLFLQRRAHCFVVLSPHSFVCACEQILSTVICCKYKEPASGQINNGVMMTNINPVHNV